MIARQGPVRSLLRAILAAAVRRRLRWSNARVGLALCYHAVAERAGDPVNELSAATSIAEFRRHLRHLRRDYRVVPASALVAAVAGRRRGQRLPVAITFDDDLPSHLSAAVPALRGKRLPATFFLSGAGIDGPFSFWWQLLQRAWEEGLVGETMLRAWGLGVPDPSLREVAQRLQALPPAERDAAAATLRDALDGELPDETLSGEGVRALGASGFEIGFHTRRHDDLHGLDDDALRDAMRAGREELEDLVGPLTVISYPHGGADPRVAAAAREAGFDFGFVADGSAVASTTDHHLLGRRYPVRGGGNRFALATAATLLGAHQALRRASR